MVGFNEDIFKISEDIERAKDLFEMANERLEIVIGSIPKRVPYKILEEYYEVVVQLMTSLMYAEGYKTLSHISLINFLSKRKGFNYNEIKILDVMRKFRHGTVYYGRRESGNFYINHKKDIKKIIDKLILIVRKKLEESNRNDKK